MHEVRKAKLAEFAAWADQHITGDEKGQAQIFLDRLFIAFGRGGSLDVGGTAEMRIRKAKEDGGGTAFADYVWKPVVLIEMKKRGADLSRHYRQAFDYWTRLVPGRPQYVVLCNFDEFWIYDFNTQLDTPKDKLTLAELPDRWGPLAFLFPTNEKPRFDNDREAVTREAADYLAVCFNKLVARKVDRPLAQRFILQTLVALFAEDIGLLNKYTVAALLDDIQDPSDAYDLLGGLFVEMNTPGVTPSGRFKGVRYFNGGLFREPARLPELFGDELAQLKSAAGKDWSKVSPEIFGELFQKSMDAEQRHAFGAHFTYPSDIMKIVKPTIVDPWTEAIESAKNGTRLEHLQERLSRLRVLDPACGSGNFLYLAYREMKRLESRIRERLTGEFPGKHPRFAHVNARQFFGLDINEFAVELAKVTMMIGRKLAIDELHILDEPPLPLDNLDANFQARDALIDADGKVAVWPTADVIIGNPPFMGAKWLKPTRGPDYVNAVRDAYPDVPGMADYCVYWFRRASDLLPQCTALDSLIGRGGLVGTQNIRNNQSRVGGLDHLVKTGTVIEAVENQPWSGEANVNVSIVNWIKSTDSGVLPKTRRLWRLSRDHAVAKNRKRTKRADGARVPDYDLVPSIVSKINAALSDDADVSTAGLLQANETPKRVFQGVTPGHDGFLLTPADRTTLLNRHPDSAPVIHGYLSGRELLTGDGTPERFIIDFQRRTLIEASAFKGAFDRIKTRVLPDRLRKAEEGKDAAGNMRPHHRQFLDRWWALAWDRKELFAGFESLSGRFVACSRVTMRPIFVFLSTDVWPSDKVQAFLMDDDYSFGVLQSACHWDWFKSKCSKLTERFSYSTESVFDTFPWPQSPTRAQIDAVAEAGRQVRRVRADALTKIKGGLRAVYRTLELPGANPLKDAHAALDAAVLKAYHFDPKQDLLAQLLALNQQVAAKEKAGEKVTPPGVPPDYGDAASLVTDDCIKP